MTILPTQVIKKHDNFFVLRDDLLEGGTKRRILNQIIPKIPENEIVYAAHSYGYAGFALALAALDYGKKVKLFFPSPRVDTEVFLKTIQLPNVSFEILANITEQLEATETAKKYAEENKALFLPIGFNFPDFADGLVDLAKSLSIQPNEVWVLGGSGILSRCLSKAWPNAQINVVSMGFPQGRFLPEAKIYLAPEKPDHVAEIPPPYPSAPHYDAKIWRFAKEKGSKDALIWNVA